MPVDGRPGGGGVLDGAADLVCARVAAPSGPDVQALDDPRFEEKLVDVVGLYLNPPENAIVLCMDEKSQIQALDRTQPTCRSNPGGPGR